MRKMPVREGTDNLHVEREDGVLVGQLAVDRRERRELLLQVVLLLVLRVEEDLEELAAVNRHARALADNLRRGDDVLEDRLVDRRERARARAHLDALARAVLVEDRALGHEDDVLLRELLLEVANQAAVDLLHVLPHAVRREDDDRLVASERRYFGEISIKKKIVQNSSQCQKLHANFMP